VADSDDWRVTISVSYAQAGQAQQSFSLRQVEGDIRRRVGRGIVVGAGEAQIFLYADTEAAAGDAERIARDVLAGHGTASESALHRWHPIEERWETPDVPMPQTKAERQAEHQRLVDAEAAESLATGVAQWEVRAELGSHRQAVALARKLESEATRSDRPVPGGTGTGGAGPAPAARIPLAVQGGGHLHRRRQRRACSSGSEVLQGSAGVAPRGWVCC